MKRKGIFAKVFIYTVLFSALLVGVATAILLQQLLLFRSQLRMQSITNSYNDSFDSLKEADDVEQGFRIFDRSQSFEFCIMDKKGNIVYKTRDADKAGIATDRFADLSPATIMIRLDREYSLHAITDDIFGGNYSKWAVQAVLIAAAMLAACIVAAIFFASRITKPIKALADSANKMANLEEVPPMPERGDELGALARDIHSMYAKLKDEILREAELAETQRYFFAAASHELKTPVAATSVLLEGMLANIGDFKDHPKYLRECMKLIDTQNNLIGEMLEVVSLTDGKIIPAPEKLNLKSVIAKILPGFQTLAEANGQRVIVDISECHTVVCDPKMLRKILSNVILNAVQNTPADGELRIWSEPMSEKLRICLLNTGTRIDDTVLPKLFAPFYRVNKARSRKDGRSGLGLTIVRKTLESMNIDYELKNTADGVLFRMDLPITED
ncbi:MAG: HAMP domain-containing histidine kinase [Oscillospiraceae bacterium]|jgi:two-component system sensor histidine kinase VanS|nr:HAMP domain-containing histidine kinase [Oscillospiraceae bacterium]